MDKLPRGVIAGVVATLFAYAASAVPTVDSTTVIGTFTGPQGTLHADNISPNLIEYYGTDLGFSYEHSGKVHFLFGDTLATEEGELIQASTGGLYDDGFGTVDLATYPNPSLFTSVNMPLIKLGQNASSTEMSAINPGHALEFFKTPVGGFSNGTREYGVFYTSKPQGCLTTNDHCDNHIANLSCDTGLGFFGEEYFEDEGFTGACIDGDAFCLNDTMANIWGWPIAGTGFCRDQSSTIWANTPVGRAMGVGLKLRVGIRSTTDARSYTGIKEWLTNKFLNIAVRTAQDFVPGDGSGYANHNYNVATGSGSNRRVLIWGRPGYIGVNANSRTLGLYFAYVDMPTGTPFNWVVNYYTGTTLGVPQFSTNESAAVPLDLDSGTGGVQSTEPYDVVNQMSVIWVDHLKKWVMFYGGGATNLPTLFLGQCGVVEFFTSAECTDVVMGNGAIRMRTADDPWGPWTPPQDVIVGGDPAVSPPQQQFAPGGVLHHPDCVGGTCAPHTDAANLSEDEYGFLYGANIVNAWIKPAGASVDLIWNASTWDPYRVVLLRTRIDP
jgi:hypothetical protein